MSAWTLAAMFTRAGWLFAGVWLIVWNSWPSIIAGFLALWLAYVRRDP